MLATLRIRLCHIYDYDHEPLQLCPSYTLTVNVLDLITDVFRSLLAGECPAVSTLRMPCIAGHPGECEYDSQCNGGEKCCDTNCNYKQCITEPIDPVPILEEGSSTDNQVDYRITCC